MHGSNNSAVVVAPAPDGSDGNTTQRVQAALEHHSVLVEFERIFEVSYNKSNHLHPF